MGFKRHNQHSYTDNDLVGSNGIDLPFEPSGLDPVIRRAGDRLFFGYIVHDEDGPNPLKEFDGNGELFTEGEGVITDDKGALLGHLGLEDTPDRNGQYRDLEHDGVYELAKQKLWDHLYNGGAIDLGFIEYCRENYEPETQAEADIAVEFCERCFDEIDWGRFGDVLPSWLDTLWQTKQEDAWDELYAQGKIGTYLAVPVRYHDSVHGPGTTQIYPTSIDDCNAVWVPGQLEIDNMDLSACTTYAEKLAVATEYAKGCLNEYAKWCNGDCWGRTTLEFQKVGGEDDAESDPIWEQVGDDDSVWGFIGSDYATEELESAAEAFVKEHSIEQIS